MSTELVGCSVDPRISCGVRKLTRTSRIIKKKIELHTYDVKPNHGTIANSDFDENLRASKLNKKFAKIWCDSHFIS
jgi:hypothetical protein